MWQIKADVDLRVITRYDKILNHLKLVIETVTEQKNK